MVSMLIGERIRAWREKRGLTQGDIEQRAGLLRCYLSRVENGHTVPSIETLEKIARALEVPLYQLFYDGDKPPAAIVLPKTGIADEKLFRVGRKECHYLQKLQRLLGRLD